jgi:hypothetical protein
MGCKISIHCEEVNEVCSLDFLLVVVSVACCLIIFPIVAFLIFYWEVPISKLTFVEVFVQVGSISPAIFYVHVIHGPACIKAHLLRKVSGHIHASLLADLDLLAVIQLQFVQLLIRRNTL